MDKQTVINSKPKISVLIPTYNRAKLVSDAIESVLNQPYSNFEIICSDNASTDRTLEILERYAEKDNRVKLLCSNTNLGPVKNWKNCLDAATGDWVHWLWSDDWVMPNFYTDACELISHSPSCVVTTWNYRSDDPLDKTNLYNSWRFDAPRLPGHHAARKVLLSTKELPVSPAAYLLPTALVRDHFYEQIPRLSAQLDPVGKGVGVDSLMVVGCCLNSQEVLVLQKPSVVFRKGDNISTTLSQDGTLGRLYALSHAWFMARYQVSIRPWEHRLLIKRIKLTLPQLIKFTPIIVRGLIKSIFAKKISAEHKSRQAFFQ